MLSHLIPCPFYSPCAWLPGPISDHNQAAFALSNWQSVCLGSIDDQVIHHPTNPGGRHWATDTASALWATCTVIKDRFCGASLENVSIKYEIHTEMSILRSLRKLLGLARLWLGFAIGGPRLDAKISAGSKPSLRLVFEAVSL